MGHYSYSRASAAVGTALAALILLSGCTSTPQDPADPPASISPSATTTDPGTATESPAPVDSGFSGAAANSGTLLISIAPSDLPVDAACHGFAQSIGTVTTGGGEVGGATIRLGAISTTSSTEALVPVGEYLVHLRCTADSDAWEGSAASVKAQRNQETEVPVALYQLP